MKMMKNKYLRIPHIFFLIPLTAFFFLLVSSLYSQEVIRTYPNSEKKFLSEDFEPILPLTSVPSKRSCKEIFFEYQIKLEKLAQVCEKCGMSLEARITRSYIYQKEPYFLKIPLLTVKTQKENLPHDATNEQKKWFTTLRQLQEHYANETFAMTEKLVAKKQGYGIVACVLQTLYINPDHVQARKFLGYSLYNDEWHSSWEVQKLENGYIDDPKYGWLSSRQIKKYHNGERFYHNQWITQAEEEKKIIESFSGWKINTEHFSILSRVSLERGVEIGRFLEFYYQVWSHLFYPFIANEKQWTARLHTTVPTVTKRHKVIHYRNRTEYVRELRKHDYIVSQSIGGYFPDLKCIFVYEPNPIVNEDCFNLFSMLAHEVTHQLFNECNITNSSYGKNNYSKLAQTANFWAIEGIAITAETFNLDFSDGKAIIGGFQNVLRMEDALITLLEEKKYLPMRKFVGMSRNEFQKFHDLNLLYSQAAGLTSFFLFYNEGTYCEAFVKYLYSIYQGVDDANSLEQLTHKSFEELDEEYRNFMNNIYNKIIKTI